MTTASRYPTFSRNFDDEQDYVDAAASAARRASPLLGGLAPVLRWKKGLRPTGDGESKGSGPPSGNKKFKALVVGFEGGPASFARTCFGLTAADWVGTLILPGAASSASPSCAAGGAYAPANATSGGLGDSLDPADPFNSACNIFLKKGGGGSDAGGGGGGGGGGVGVGDGSGVGDGDGVSNGGDGIDDVDGVSDGVSGGGDGGDGGGDGGDGGTGGGGGGGGGGDGDVVVALCGYRVPPAQAHAWAKALLSAIDAEVVVALTSVVVEPGRSEGWEGARLLATSEAEERGDCLKMSRGFMPLPTPTMLSGPSAALVSYCERHGRAAMCFAASQAPRRQHQQQSGVQAERSLSCTRKPLGVLAGGVLTAAAAVAAAAAAAAGDGVGAGKLVDSSRDSSSSSASYLYL